MLRQLLVVCNSSWQRGLCIGQTNIANEPALSALLTAAHAFVDPGGLPTATLLLRERRRLRGRGQALSSANSLCVVVKLVPTFVVLRQFE
jgi:hypothetical protein